LKREIAILVSPMAAIKFFSQQGFTTKKSIRIVRTHNDGKRCCS